VCLRTSREMTVASEAPFATAAEGVERKDGEGQRAAVAAALHGRRRAPEPRPDQRVKLPLDHGGEAEG